MKRLHLLSSLVLVLSMVCSNSYAQKKDWPWDFPKATKIDVKAGQMALAPYTFYPKAVSEGKELIDQTMIFYSEKVKSVKGDLVEFDYENGTLPSSLVIPIPAGQVAKKGDVIVTWWQSGSGMQQAYVTEGGAAPKVEYLGLEYKEDGSGFANSFSNEQLKPNTFFVLKNGELQSGAPVAFKEGDSDRWKYGTLINKSADKALILGFADCIFCANLSDVKVIPIQPDYKVGDEVGYAYVGSFNTGKVKKIDMKIGRVWVEGPWGDDEILSITQICKAVANQE